ncbi:MAG TPA: hypothetical protein VK514_01895, partial [Candidatus Acidoferrum sp.]|nr:hypothetical protein [Candidatus Acidoferrum sp.]
NPKHSTSRGFYYNPFINDTVPQEQRTVAGVMRQSDGICFRTFGTKTPGAAYLPIALVDRLPRFGAHSLRPFSTRAHKTRTANSILFSGAISLFFTLFAVEEISPVFANFEPSPFAKLLLSLYPLHPPLFPLQYS